MPMTERQRERGRYRESAHTQEVEKQTLYLSLGKAGSVDDVCESSLTKKGFSLSLSSFRSSVLLRIDSGIRLCRVTQPIPIE